MIGQPVLRSTLSSAVVPLAQTNGATTRAEMKCQIDEYQTTIQSNSTYWSVGTSIKLTPSTSAFRKQVGGSYSASKLTTPHAQKG